MPALVGYGRPSAKVYHRHVHVLGGNLLSALRVSVLRDTH